MTVVDGPPQNLEMDLEFLEGLDLPDLQHISLPEASGQASTSSDSQQEPARPSKGQRYRSNRKVWGLLSLLEHPDTPASLLLNDQSLSLQTLTSNLEARLQELRLAIESKELERQELLLRQKDLEAGLQAAAGAPQAKSTLELATQVWVAFKCLPACILSLCQDESNLEHLHDLFHEVHQQSSWSTTS